MLQQSLKTRASAQSRQIELHGIKETDQLARLNKAGFTHHAVSESILDVRRRRVPQDELDRFALFSALSASD